MESKYQYVSLTKYCNKYYTLDISYICTNNMHSLYFSIISYLINKCMNINNQLRN